MVAGEKEAPFGQRHVRRVREFRTRFQRGKPERWPRFQDRVERDPPEREPHAHVFERRHFAHEVLPAMIQLLEGGLVVRRRTARGGRDVGAFEDKAVRAMKRPRRAGKPLAVKLSIEPFPGPIPGEHPPGPVRPVRSGRQANDEEPCVGIAEARHRTSPVFLVAVRLSPHASDLGAIGAETRAALARDHVAGNAREIRGHGVPPPEYNMRPFPGPIAPIFGGIVTKLRILPAILAAAFIAASSPGARAELTPGTPAPNFTGGRAWLNSRPLSLKKELKSKVVLVDFWGDTCINCIHTLPALKRIYSPYKPHGFESVDVPASWAIPPDTDDFNPVQCGPMSEETYVGTERGSRWGGEIANREGFQPGKVVLYSSMPRQVRRGFFAHGLWKNNADDFEHARATTEAKDYIGIRYRGNEVYVVMNLKRGQSARVYVTRDGKPVPAPRRGVDVAADARGRTYIDLREGRMYYAIQGEDRGTHDLRLSPTDLGVAINSFTFGNRCLTKFDRL